MIPSNVSMILNFMKTAIVTGIMMQAFLCGNGKADCKDGPLGRWSGDIEYDGYNDKERIWKFPAADNSYDPILLLHFYSVSHMVVDGICIGMISVPGTEFKTCSMPTGSRRTHMYAVGNSACEPRTIVDLMNFNRCNDVYHVTVSNLPTEIKFTSYSKYYSKKFKISYKLINCIASTVVTPTCPPTTTTTRPITTTTTTSTTAPPSKTYETTPAENLTTAKNKTDIGGAEKCGKSTDSNNTTILTVIIALLGAMVLILGTALVVALYRHKKLAKQLDSQHGGDAGNPAHRQEVAENNAYAAVGEPDAEAGGSMQPEMVVNAIYGQRSASQAPEPPVYASVNRNK